MEIKEAKAKSISRYDLACGYIQKSQFYNKILSLEVQLYKEFEYYCVAIKVYRFIPSYFSIVSVIDRILWQQGRVFRSKSLTESRARFVKLRKVAKRYMNLKTRSYDNQL